MTSYPSEFTFCEILHMHIEFQTEHLINNCALLY